MALINRAGQEVSAKVVYYGPGLSGKTTNLEVLFRQVPEDQRGKMISMKTRTDRTLFFDLLPLSGDSILDFNVRILLYTVPGQVYYNATRRLVLKGVDAVVFVADSQRGKMEENLESLENLRSNLADMNLKLEDLPWVIQYNKRDLPDVLSVEELEQALNPAGVPSYSAVAPRGEGVQETLVGVTEHLRPRLRALVEKELGESLRSAPSASPSRSMPPAPLPPQDLAPPVPPSAEPPAQRSGLNLDHLPDPRVVELTPGELRTPHPRPGTPIADLMEAGDVRRALREVETSIEASPLRSLADTLPLPSAPTAPPPASGASALERMTAGTAPPAPISRVVPEIVELEELPSAAPRPAPGRAVAPWASQPPMQAPSAPIPPATTDSAPLSAAPPAESAPPPSSAALWASTPPAAAAPAGSSPVAPPERAASVPPASSGEHAAPPAPAAASQPFTLRIPRSALSGGELVLRLVLEDAPAPTASPSGGHSAEAGSAPGWMATAAPVREAAPGNPVTRGMASEAQAGASPESAPVAVGRAPSAPARPAGAGMRFALRDGELVPLE